MKVIIIGAGIGGACLAHGLRKHGLDVALFERSGAAATGLPGYGIHINVFGQQALEHCLPEASWREFRQRSKIIGGRARFYDEQLRLLADVQVTQLKDGQLVRENRMAISRAELRDLLLIGLTETIQWNRKYARYERLAGGRVRAHFEDGSHEDGDVLIGADGCNSRVRQQYLPHLSRLSLGVHIVVGRARLTPALRRALPAELVDGAPNSLVPRSPDWMFVSSWRAPVDTSAHATEAIDATEVDDFAVWAYVAAERALPPDAERLEPRALFDWVLPRLDRWHPSLSQLVRASDLPSVAVVPLKSMPKLPAWDASSVVLLGDAIHNMTPMAGVGANTALRDARRIAQALADVAAGRSELERAIAGYEREMRGYANRSVALSLRNARNAAAGSKLGRTLFRGVLRVAQLMPPLKARLFPPGR